MSQALPRTGTVKPTRQAARYIAGGGRERCGQCRHFRAPTACDRIIGPISAGGWCRYYSEELVASIYQPQGAAGFGGGATLDLTFIDGSGQLDPRITFTRGSTATYFDSSGTLQTVSGNTPRFDYDPVTHVLRGLLIEEARINLGLQSSNFTVTWFAGNSTATTGISGAPDGSATVSRLAENTVNTTHYLLQNVTTVASTTYTFSVYAKASQDRYLQMAFTDGGFANGGYATFDLQAGVISQAIAAVGTGVIGVARIQSVGVGFYRCTISSTIGTATASACVLVLSNSGTPGFLPAYVGNVANGLLLWGAQLEQGAFPTSYIPTAGAAVTRAQDTCYIPTAAWFNASTYSLEAEYDTVVVGSVKAGVGDGVFGNSSYLTGDGFAYAGTGLTASGFSISAGPVMKQCGAFSTTQLWCCNNGSNVGTASGPVPAQSTATRLTIGCSPWGLDNPLNGHMRRVRYWPRVLSNAELQAVTT